MTLQAKGPRLFLRQSGALFGHKGLDYVREGKLVRLLLRSPNCSAPGACRALMRIVPRLRLELGYGELSTREYGDARVLAFVTAELVDQ